MNSDQILDLVKNDPYLKKIPVSIVCENDLPAKLPLNHIFFVLIAIRKKNTKGHSTVLGHWILLETLSNGKMSKKKQISYFDPMGFGIFSTKIKLIIKRSPGHTNLFVNSICFQHPISAICGPIVCYIALLRSRGDSYTLILKKKISANLLFNVKNIPLFIKPLLSKKNQFLPRFSLQFL